MTTVKEPAYRCRRCRHMKSRHTEREGGFFCAGTTNVAKFERYIQSPNRISNSFSGEEVKALNYVIAKLLTGAFGPQPAAIQSGVQTLAIKARAMTLRLEQQQRDHG